MTYTIQFQSVDCAGRQRGKFDRKNVSQSQLGMNFTSLELGRRVTDTWQAVTGETGEQVKSRKFNQSPVTVSRLNLSNSPNTKIWVLRNGQVLIS